MAVELSTAAGQVRLLIPDVDESHLLFTDAQIDAFLTIEGDVVKRAAATAIEALARDQAMLLKVVTVRGQAGVSTDGAKLAAELRQQAAQLRADADQDSSGFAIAEHVHSPGQAATRLLNDAQQQG